MKQYEKIKKEISKCESAIEMIGYLHGINVAAIVYCKHNCPDEIIQKETGNEVSICGMKYFLESEAEHESTTQ